MFGIDDHSHTFGVEVLVEPVGNLLGETLLHLKTPGEVLHYPSQFGQPDDPRSGEIADMGHPFEGQQVMLAQGVERDVALRAPARCSSRRWGTWSG